MQPLLHEESEVASVACLTVAQHRGEEHVFLGGESDGNVHCFVLRTGFREQLPPKDQDKPAATGVPLASLPGSLIQQGILAQLDYESLLEVTRTCRWLYSLSSPLMYRLDRVCVIPSPEEIAGYRGPCSIAYYRGYLCINYSHLLTVVNYNACTPPTTTTTTAPSLTASTSPSSTSSSSTTEASTPTSVIHPPVVMMGYHIETDTNEISDDGVVHASNDGMVYVTSDAANPTRAVVKGFQLVISP